MRIKIIMHEVISLKEIKEDEDLTRKQKSLLCDLIMKDVWIDDFPCRLNDGDMVRFECLGTEWAPFVGLYDDPFVGCHSFDKDERGFYETVWLRDI